VTCIVVEVRLRRQNAPTLWAGIYWFLSRLMGLLARGGGADGERDLEIAVLRHQIAVISRLGKRSRYRTADWTLLAAAARLLPRERWSCFLVRPETLLRWDRQFRCRTPTRPRRKPGRPPIDREIRDLVIRLGRENPRGGYMRIRGELLKLGIGVSATTIATVLRRVGLGPAPRRIGPTWSEFLHAQAFGFLARDPGPDRVNEVFDVVGARIEAVPHEDGPPRVAVGDADGTIDEAHDLTEAAAPLGARTSPSVGPGVLLTLARSMPKQPLLPATAARSRRDVGSNRGHRPATPRGGSSSPGLSIDGLAQLCVSSGPDRAPCGSAGLRSTVTVPRNELVEA
jgi:hypothetical protein